MSGRTRPLWVAGRDADGRLAAGARCLLWVAEHRRRQGLGTRMMVRIERTAAAEGCTGILLNTFTFRGTFQAPGFYRRRGYAAFGELLGLPPGETRYWMSRRIAPAPGQNIGTPPVTGIRAPLM